MTSQCLDDFPGLAVIEHVHDIAVPEGVWCDRNRKVYPVSFGPSDSLLQPVAHGFVGHVNATMFDRYGDADDFLDSQEIKHVY